MIMGKVQYSSLTVMEDNRGKIVYFFNNGLIKTLKSLLRIIHKFRVMMRQYAVYIVLCFCVMH